jgi:signal peptidase I
MQTFSIARKVTVRALWLIAAVLIWYFFAPPSLGGRTTYVFTNGVSMQPLFHTGDLAIVRSESSYRVGEIVAYRSKLLHTIVLHRIVGRDGSRYLFKGDDNNFIDFEHPAANQLVGALWLHVPGSYLTALRLLRKPAALGGLVAFGALLLTGGLLNRRRRRRRRGAPAATARSAEPLAPPRLLALLSGTLLACGATCLLGAGVLAAVAYSRPESGLTPTSVPFSQRGAFGYSGAAPAGPAYPDGKVSTAEPLFTRLLDNVTVRFDYSFAAAEPHTLSGRASLEAQVSSADGWSRTLALAGPTAFSGDHVRLAGTLHLAELEATLARLETTTQVSDPYTLTLKARVSTRGVLAGLPIHGVFAAPLAFSLSAYELQPQLPSAEPAVGATTPVQNPLLPTASATVVGRVSRPGVLRLVIGSLSVANARRVARDGIALALLLVLAAFALVPSLRRHGRRSAAASFVARHERGLVSVRAAPTASGGELVDVASLDALALIAQRYERLLLHETGAEQDVFYVVDDGVVYRHELGEEEHAPLRGSSRGAEESQRAAAVAAPDLALLRELSVYRGLS